MARHLIRSLWFAVLAAAFVLEGCSKPSPPELDRPVQAVAVQAAAADQAAPPPPAAHYEGLSAPSAPRPEQYQTEDPPPWLAEMLHAPDPNARIQALDAWAQHPGASLNPVAYALVDPDESVRARAQELLEEELARR